MTSGKGDRGKRGHGKTVDKDSDCTVDGAAKAAKRTTLEGIPFRIGAAAVVAIAGVLLRFLWKAPRRPAAPVVYSYRLVRKYRHDSKAFTQGLLWFNGTLYESTGLFGRSSVREVRLTGLDGRLGRSEVVRQVKLDKGHFGEGLVRWNGELLQLLWKRPDGLRYAARSGAGGYLELLPEGGFRTPLTDGWGLATDGSALLATDSGPDVFFLDPTSLALQRTFRVTDAGQPVEMLNELEVIDGELWANVFGQECLARISLDTGEVQGWVVLTDLLNWAGARRAALRKGQEMPDVLNGIAWDPMDRRLFVTGKLWPLLFEIEVIPTTNISLEEARQRCLPQKNVFK